MNTRLDPNETAEVDGKQMTIDVRALTVDDAVALKLAIAIALGGPPTRGRNPLIDLVAEIETPYEDFRTTLDKVSRVEVNQRRLWKIHQTGHELKDTVSFEWLITEDDIPGGRTALVRAVSVRLFMLLGTPVPADERGNGAGALSKNSIDRLAASVQIVEQEPSVH